jgi:hypothetical protein
MKNSITALALGLLCTIGSYAQNNQQDTNKKKVPTQSGFPSVKPTDSMRKIQPSDNSGRAPSARDSVINNSERKMNQRAPSKSEMRVPKGSRAPVGSANRNAISK